MIVDYGRVRRLRPGEASVTTRGYDLSWRGVPYLPGVHPGVASVVAALDADSVDPLLGAARQLRGSFVLSICETRSGRHVVVTDPGSMLDAYVVGAQIGTSYVQLAEETGATLADVDGPAAAEFLDLGQVYEGRTTLRRIRRLLPGCAYELHEGTDPVAHDLGLPRIDAGPDEGFTPQRFFGDLAASLSGARVSVDLSGGSDSRLVAAMLAGSLEMECAVSGTAGARDIAIASQVARALRCPLYVTVHDASDVDSVAQELFETSDAQSDMLAFHRQRQLATGRAERQVAIASGGAGGELYKDFWWLQDFPRYRRRTANLERLFDLRFRPIAFPAELLGPRLAPHAGEVRPRVLAAMRERVMPINTQTYDRIYYEMKMRTVAAHAISMNDCYVPYFAPLLDPAMVRLGYALPRRDRTFGRFHRRLITAASPAAARLPSTEGGMTLSSTAWDELRDAGAWAADKLQRLISKAGQRVARRTVLHANLDDPHLVATARSSEPFRRALTCLVGTGLLAPNARHELPDAYVGRVMTLGLLVERLGG
jgi:hypothetical protein